MRWMIFYAKSGNKIITEISNIDRIIVDPDTREGSLKLSNGDRYDIIDDCIWDRLLMIEEKAKIISLYGMSVARPMPVTCPCPDRDKCDSCGRTQEVQDLKLENDRLNQKYNLLYDSFSTLFVCEDKDKDNCYSCPLFNYDCDEIVRFIKNYFKTVVKKLEDI